jgi:DNA-directed RNA polymerase subunit N (RpoN/RPB10)
MNDWIRLLVKYKGKCSSCGKEISAGQYALWSKNSKAIKHSECKAPPPATTTTTEKIDPDTNRQQTTAAEVDCFICGRPVAGNNSSFEAYNYGRQAISQASICNRCLEDKNAYQNYQHAFLEKVHKVAKVKL